MNSDPRLPRSAWAIIALLWFVGFFNYFDRVMITSMRMSVIASIPMTETQFGLLTSVFFWVYGFLSPFAGFLADRFSRSLVIILSLFVWSALTWLTGHAKTFEQLLLARALMGISEACYIPAALALIADYHRGATRSLATGLHMTGIMAGSALGGLGGMMAERRGWSFAFGICGMIGVGYSLLLAFTLRDAPVAADAALGVQTNQLPVRWLPALKSLFCNGMFILVLIYWGLLGLTGTLFIGWMPTYLGEHFHLTQGVAGFSATGYNQAAALCGMIIGGAWADRWNRTNARGRILVPVIGLCAAAPAIFIVAHTSILGFAIAGLILAGLASAFASANMMPILCLVTDSRYRATGYGFLNFCSCVVGGTAVFAGGALRDANVDLAKIFQFAACCTSCCAVLLFMVKPRVRS